MSNKLSIENSLDIAKLVVNCLSFIPYILIFLAFIFGKSEKTFVTKLFLQLTIMATIRTITCIISVKTEALCKIQDLLTIFPDYAIQFLLFFISYIANVFMFYQDIFQQKKKKFISFLIILGYLIPLLIGLLFTFLDKSLTVANSNGFCWISDKTIMIINLFSYFIIVVFNLFYLIKNIHGVHDFEAKNSIDCSKFSKKLLMYLASSILLLSIEIFGYIVYFLRLVNSNTDVLDKIQVLLESMYLPIVTSVYSFNLQIKEELKQIFCLKKDAIDALIFEDDGNSTDNRTTINEFRNSYL